MDNLLTVQNIANVALFIAPGYFAIQAYSAVHCKPDKNFSKLLVAQTIDRFTHVNYVLARGKV